jgi:hypothetical protein
MPLNASSVEFESKEFAFTGFNDVAFDRINDQFQTVAQDPADTTQHTPRSGKLMASFLKLFVQRVEHNVGQQG